MKARKLYAAVIAFAIVGTACSRQESPPSSERHPIAVGDTAPAFSLRSASGDTVSLSDYAGKPVLLYFSMGPG